MEATELKLTLFRWIDRLGEEELQLVQQFIVDFLPKIQNCSHESLEQAYLKMGDDEARGKKSYDLDTWNSFQSPQMVQEPAPTTGYIATLPENEQEKLRKAYQQMGEDEANHVRNFDW